MSTLQIAYNNPAWTQIGNALSATAMNTGFRVGVNGNRSYFDIFVTGTDTIGLNGGYYGSTGSLIVSLFDTSGNLITGIGTNPITPTIPISNTTAVQTITYFSGLTPATTYWLRISPGSLGNNIVQSDAVVQLSSATTTPSVSVVTGYNPSQIYGFNAVYDGVINIQSKVGMEGQIGLNGGTQTSGEFIVGSGNTTQSLNGFGFSGGKIRFKGSFTDLYLRFYNPGATIIHLQSVALNGSSGTPTSLATYTNPQTLTNYGPWIHVASGLSSATALYELMSQNNPSGGFLLAQIMTSGGTGIDTTTTTSALTRSQFFNTLGDSIVAQDYPVGNLCWQLETEGISQTENKAVLNVGVDGITLATLSTSTNLITSLTTGSVPSAGIMIRAGINDIKSGSPPSVATNTANMVLVINQIRAKGGGWATCAINIEGILPTSAEPYSYINQYNKGTGGYQSMVAQYNAGTISGQSPNPDPNIFYRDVDTMQLGGPNYPTGTFVGTNYADGLHPNTTGGAIIQAFELAYLGTNPTVSSAVVNSAGNSVAVTWSIPGTPPLTGTTGLTLLVNGVSRSFTISLTSPTHTLTPASTIYQSDTVLLNYSPGNIQDSASPTPTPALAFSNYAVTNNSTQVLAPQIAPTVTITGISGGIAVNASTSEAGVTSFDYVQNGGTPVTGVSSPQNYTISNLTTPETFAVNSRNSAGTGPATTVQLGGSGGGTALTLTITKPAGNPVLTWTADSLATSYNVLRATAISGPYTRIANPASGTLTYTDTSEPSGTIQYAVTSNH